MLAMLSFACSFLRRGPQDGYESSSITPQQTVQIAYLPKGEGDIIFFTSVRITRERNPSPLPPSLPSAQCHVNLCRCQKELRLRLGQLLVICHPPKHHRALLCSPWHSINCLVVIDLVTNEVQGVILLMNDHRFPFPAFSPVHNNFPPRYLEETMLLFLTGVRNRDALAPRFRTRERLELLT